MDSFELNKIIAAFLIALLIAMVGSLIGNYVINPEKIEKNAYVVDIPKTDSGTSSEKPKELELISPLLAKADVQNGEKIFKKCSTCHTIGKGEPHKVGPNLWSIVGALMAHEADFAYSEVLKNKKETWDIENLNKFLYKPREFMPGTKMTFPGLGTAQERADVIAYLNSHSDTVKPLP